MYSQIKTNESWKKKKKYRRYWNLKGIYKQISHLHSLQSHCMNHNIHVLIVVNYLMGMNVKTVII